MSEVALSPQTIAEINHTFIAALKEEGLVLMPERYSAAVALVYEKRKKLLAKKWVTPYEIAKFNLLDRPVTVQTVKNMITDGRISENETYIDAKDKHQVLVSAIKRINNDKS